MPRATPAPPVAQVVEAPATTAPFLEPPRAEPGVPAEPCPNWGPLSAALENVAADVSVAVIEIDGPCRYAFEADRPLAAASTIKLLALAGVLELAEREGRGLSDYETAMVEPMIAMSDNAAASATFDYLEATGQTTAELGARWGVTAQHPSWGRSAVTAAQMAGLVESMFGGRLGPAYAAEARRLLDLPDADFATQWRIAVGYGLPSGWYYGSKVGLLHLETGGIHTHGVGLIESPDGSTRYAVAFLSNNWGGFESIDRAAVTLDELGGILSDAIVSAESPQA